MAHPRVYATEAVILRRIDFGEADRILTLFTPNYGKVRAVAKGVRRTTSRLAGHLEPFTRTQLLELAYDVNYAGFDRTVDAHIKNLRRKIEPDPRDPKYVLTIYGVGYKFVEDIE